MAKAKPTKKTKVTAEATHFFERELAGEASLTRATAEILYDLAAEFFLRRPWNILADRDLTLVEAPDSQEMCYCSVMGAAGQVFSLYAYLGLDGYRMFKRLASGDPILPGEFFASQHGVSVEFVPSPELTPPDRKLLRALGHTFKRGGAAPIFRARRPGYHEWYVTEDEGQLLALCLEMVSAFCDHLSLHPDAGYWSDEDVYPLVTRMATRRRKPEYQISVVKAECPPPPVAEPPALNEEQIGRIRKQDYPVRGVMEVDHFYGGGMIGRKHERKACMRTALAIDAGTGYAYPPVLGKASDGTGDLLVRAVLAAIESSHFIPLEVQAKDTEFATLLGPLGNALSFSVQVAKSLPALEHAKEQLLRVMGDPGPFGG